MLQPFTCKSMMTTWTFLFKRVVRKNNVLCFMNLLKLVLDKRLYFYTIGLVFNSARVLVVLSLKLSHIFPGFLQLKQIQFQLNKTN